MAAGLLPLRAQASSHVNILRRIVDQGMIRVGVLRDIPPWGGTDEDSRPDGSEVALARLLAGDMGVHLVFVRLGHQEVLRTLLEDRCDVLATALPIVGATLARVAFAAPHGRTGVVFAASSNLRLASLGDLAGKRIAMPAGSFAAEIAHPLLPPGATALFTPSPARALESLLLGEVDVAVTYDWQLRDLSLARADLDILPRLDVASWNYGLAAQLGQPDLMRFLNTFLFLRGADGSLADIHARYFAAPLPGGLRFH
jgi:polar amino acid transport system substrate-binding protein